MAAIILTVAIAIICWRALELSFWVVPCIMLVGVGGYLITASLFLPKQNRIGPSASSYYLVNGVIVATIGALGIARITAELDWWYIIGIFLAVIALLIVLRVLSPHD